MTVLGNSATLYPKVCWLLYNSECNKAIIFLLNRTKLCVIFLGYAMLFCIETHVDETMPYQTTAMVHVVWVKNYNFSKNWMLRKMNIWHKYFCFVF